MVLIKTDMLAGDGEGGHGGRGGNGGKGGLGGGNGSKGEPGEPGSPGSPGSPGRSPSTFAFQRTSIANLVSLVVAIIGGMYWLFGLEAKISAVSRDLNNFRENVLSLNTPLSQRVFSLESRVGEISRIEGEIKTSLAAIDLNGTSQIRVLKRDLDAMRSDMGTQAALHAEISAILSRNQNAIIETQVKLQFLIDSMNNLRGKRQ